MLEVATKLGVSRERVRQIEERAIATVRKRAKDFGILETQKYVSSAVNIHTCLKEKEELNLLGDAKQSKLEKTIKKDLKNDKRRNR